MQGATVATGGEFLVCGTCLGARRVGHHQNERVQPGIIGIDARQGMHR